MIWGRADEKTTDAAAPAVASSVPTAGVAVLSSESASDGTPSTAEVAAAAVAATAASVHIAQELPEPVRATAEESPVAPLSRRARRATQTSEQPVIIPLLTDETPAPAETPASPPAARAEAPEAPVAAPALPDAVLAPAEPFELLEPVVDIEPVEVEPVEAVPVDHTVEDDAVRDRRPTASGIDEFEAAARLFSFTGETPIQAPAASGAADASEPSHVARRRRPDRAAAFRRVSAASFSVGVMGIVGLLTVGMTTPAEAVAAMGTGAVPMSVLAPAEPEQQEIPEAEIQAYVSPAGVEEVALSRTETYATTTMTEIAHQSGISNVSNFFINDPNSAIQWPFAVGVPISYGYGMRSGRMHEGADFTPGAGSPIQAIADGVVRVATSSGGAYGVHVIIDHEIDGQLVSSHYAHMQYGSLQVTPGQEVTVGTILGRTGNTGRSYGAHTHFEILLGGTTPIDPIPWLREHAGG